MKLLIFASSSPNWLWISAIAFAAAAISAVPIFPWWCFALIALLAGGLRSGSRRAVWTAGLGCGLAWVVLALVQDLRTGGRLSARIGGAMGGALGLEVAPVAYILTFLLAGIIGALSAWTGRAVVDAYQSRNVSF